MGIMDKVEQGARTITQGIMDREPANYLEAGALYGIISQGRYNLSTLEILYNHAQDPELKKLIKESMDKLINPLLKECEGLLEESHAEVPRFHFNKHQLHEKLDIPDDARLSDMEVAAGIGTMAKAAQVNILAALQQSYQLHIGMTFKKYLDDGLDWNYRLLQLMIHRGWLPHIAKVTH